MNNAAGCFRTTPFEKKKFIKVDHFSKKFTNATISAKNYSHSSEKEKIRTQH